MRPIVRAKIEQPSDESIRLIPLTNDKVATIDAEDYEKLCGISWSAVWHPRSRSWTAVATAKWGYTKMHRMVTSAPKGTAVDHINHNCLDNRKANLRFATASQNMANRRKMVNNTSGYIGVAKMSYRSYINTFTNGKTVRRWLGYFDTAEEAARARDREAIRVHGEFAHLNFPRSDYE